MGGYERSGTFIEYCKGLIDELNADHARGAIAPTQFTATTLSMHLYDSVAVFERGAHTKKWAPKIGRADFVPGTSYSGAANSGSNLSAGHGKFAQAEAAQKQLVEAVAARETAQAELQQLQQSLAVAEGTLARMHNSLSWKFTEPVRRLMAALRSGPRKTH